MLHRRPPYFATSRTFFSSSSPWPSPQPPPLLLPAFLRAGRFPLDSSRPSPPSLPAGSSLASSSGRLAWRFSALASRQHLALPFSRCALQSHATPSLPSSFAPRSISRSHLPPRIVAVVCLILAAASSPLTLPVRSSPCHVHASRLHTISLSSPCSQPPSLLACCPSSPHSSVGPSAPIFFFFFLTSFSSTCLPSSLLLLSLFTALSLLSPAPARLAPPFRFFFFFFSYLAWPTSSSLLFFFFSALLLLCMPSSFVFFSSLCQLTHTTH